MLCANCHRLVEYGYKEVPEDYIQFDEEYMNYKEKIAQYDECPICNGQKPIRNKTCSKQCAAKIRYNVD